MIESDAPARNAYQEALEDHGADPEGRMWQTHFIASRIHPHALESPGALASFYSELGLKGDAPTDATMERARRVLEKRGTYTVKRRIFDRDEYLPVIEKYVTTELIKSTHVWAPKFNKRVLPLDSLAAVLCVMTQNILRRPKNHHLLFSVSNEKQIAPFLEQCHKARAITSALTKPEKRAACVKVLQLAELIVLRDNHHNAMKHVPKKYGLGRNHPKYSLYLAHCRRLKVDPYYIDPACLSHFNKNTSN